MTNLDKWRFYMKDVFSPASWVDAGWFFTIASALQRRVWYGNIKDRPLFPNLYFVFIGPPACGKGLVIGPVTELLRHWKKDPLEQDKDPAPGQKFKPLIEMGPDAVTPEQLYKRMAECLRTMKDEERISGRPVYMHSSMAFVLEELNSLFRRNMDQVPKFLLRAYDCGDYEYDTKHQGRDLLRNMCMNFLAVGTPTVLHEANDFKIFDDGFTSRTLFIFEREPRYYSYELPSRDDEQLKVFEELKPWVKHLAGLYGPITVDPAVPTWLHETAQKEHKELVARAGPKMQSYLGRRGVMIKKIAAAMHFSESLEMHVPLSCFQRAIEWLRPIEARMQGGFSLVGRNELHPHAERIVDQLRYGIGFNQVELYAMFASELTMDEFTSILQSLVMGERVKIHNGKYYAK